MGDGELQGTVHSHVGPESCRGDPGVAVHLHMGHRGSGVIPKVVGKSRMAIHWYAGTWGRCAKRVQRAHRKP